MTDLTSAAHGRTRAFRRLLPLLLTSGALIASPAWADTDTAPASRTPAAQDGSASSVGDIVVTATRRESKLQSTPVALSVIAQADIAAHNTVTARDLAGQVPGFFISQSGITPTTQIFCVRGIGNSDPIFDPSVAVYNDDTYLPRAINGMTDLTDVERVELLRGPQATLFGQNAAAGAIRTITKTPTDHLTIKGDVAYGSYNTVQVHGYARLTVMSRLCFSLGIMTLVPAVPRESLHPAHAPFTPTTIRPVIRLPTDLSREPLSLPILVALT